MPTTTTPSASVALPRRRRLIVFASTLGTTIEWYDFMVYGTLAPLALNHVFFPSLSPVMGTIAAYTTFAVGFLSRPVGGIIFGHFGDRIGRKTILILTLLVMGIGTFLIGLLPGAASIGVAAPLLLLVLRLMQGIGVGGEWGGAVLMTIEHAPKGRRILYGSWPQLGVPLGLLSSTAAVALLNRLPSAEFLSWGWRVAFLLSALLIVIGVFVRLKIMETPEFVQAKNQNRIVSVPLTEMFRSFPRALILTLGARYIEGTCFNIFGVFIIAYIVNTLHLSTAQALNTVMAAAIVMTPMILVFGALGDRIGIKRVFATGSVLIVISTAIAFVLMQRFGAHHYWIVLLSDVVPFGIIYPMVYGTESTLFASQFDTTVRYTGVSFAYQVSGIYASGLTPLIATALLAAGDNKPWLVILYMVVVGLISFASVMAMKFHREDPLLVQRSPVYAASAE